MNNPGRNTTKGDANTDKYKEAMDEKTKILRESADDEDDIHPVSDEFSADDPISRSEEDDDDDGVDVDTDTDISEQEIEDLENSANRMPNEEDDIFDDDYLEDEDDDGESLNEGDDPMGEDLDISPEDVDANEYDNNND